MFYQIDCVLTGIAGSFNENYVTITLIHCIEVELENASIALEVADFNVVMYNGIVSLLDTVK